MNCLTCARTGAERTAVALCPHCKAGLCLDHVQETARTPGPGGMRLSCGHRTWDSAWQQRTQGRNPQESSIGGDRIATS
jgi:predicted nucleic acid binding AN1-type Zn finger protein